MQRRSLLIGAATLLGATTLAARAATPATLPVLQVWKDPNCGCCKDWISYLQRDGFQVQAFDTGNTAVRQRLGLPPKYASCHTALVGGYVVEGHVNAREIRRLLAEKPAALGLAVPGMPVGSPGMDGPEYGGRQDPYEVLLVQRDGSSRVYQPYHLAQASTPAPASTPDVAWSEAEVRRVDTATGKISLKHGEIKNLDMPPMTMVFQAQPAALQGLQAGDQVRFTAEQVRGAYTVTRIEKRP